MRNRSQPELSILLVNWNGIDLLESCLRSIADSPPNVAYNVIVVDNASSDGSVRWLQSGTADRLLGNAGLQVIQNDVNVGFGKANNQAMALSSAPMFLLLNTDTEVRPGAIDRLVATLTSDRRIGACGPRLVNLDGSLQTSVWPNPPTPWWILADGLRVYKLLPRRIRGELLLGSHWDHARRREVDMISCAAILVRRTVVEQVGGFDEIFHMYHEDVDWCLRMVRAGWRIVFEPEAVVMHSWGQSSRKRWTDLEKLEQILRNGHLFCRKHLSRCHRLLLDAATSIVCVAEWCWRKMHGKPVHDVETILRLTLTEVWHEFAKVR